LSSLNTIDEADNAATISAAKSVADPSQTETGLA
jgi:hypothetical protein